MCVPFWMLDAFLFVCVYTSDGNSLFNTICFVFLGKPRFWLFCVALFCKGLWKGVEQSSEEKHRETFCLIRVGFGGVFFSWTCALSCMEDLWERDQGTKGKRVEHFQKGGTGRKEEPETVRDVRRTCHDEAWMLKQCLWRVLPFWSGRNRTEQRTIHLVSIVASVKLRSLLLIFHYALGATQTSPKQNRKSTWQVSPWVAPGLSRKCQFWYPSDLICNYLR